MDVSAIEIQHKAPMSIGLAPVLISFTISVLIPIPAIAITMKNLDDDFNKLIKASGNPIKVVMTDANTKNKINTGNTFLRFIFSPEPLFEDL